MPPAQARLQHFQRTADHLFQRQPLFFEVKSAGLNARHVEQIIDQPGGVQHVLADFAGLQCVRGIFRRQIQRQDLRLTK
ncbi:hypothetical protein D3C87_2106700 [compost metagenome]